MEEKETILICPYCGEQKNGNEMGCCGESRDHFTEGYYDDETDEFIEI